MYKLIRSGLDPKLMPTRRCRKNWVLDIQVEADEEGADPNILVFQKNADNPDAGDMFVDVADVHDMNFLPVDAPVELPDEHPVEDYVPFYRKSKVTLDCYTADEAEAIWKKIQGRTKRLVYEYKAARALIEKEEVRA